MKLIENWVHVWWTHASTRLAMVAGFVAAYFVASPNELQALIGMVPDSLRPIVAPLVGMLVMLVAGGSRVVQFKKKAGTGE